MVLQYCQCASVCVGGGGPVASVMSNSLLTYSL